MVVLCAKIEAVERIPVRADGVFLIEAMPVSVAKEGRRGRGRGIGFELSLILATVRLRPFAPSVERPVANAGVAGLQRPCHFQKIAVGRVGQERLLHDGAGDVRDIQPGKMRDTVQILFLDLDAWHDRQVVQRHQHQIQVGHVLFHVRATRQVDKPLVAQLPVRI